MDPQVCTREVIVTLENGLHLSPSSRLAALAQKFNCDVSIRKADRAVNAKSMMDILTLAAECGTPLTLEATGDGSTEAIETLARLFENNFQLDSQPPA
jgi:phosphocarrier protein